MSVGQKLRFEIFKRDKFTCQYCGRKPPEVVLNVDHVLAVANGGDDDSSNLLTSCWDCNIGKSDRDVDQLAIPIPDDVEMRREKLEQLKAIQAVRQEEKALHLQMINEPLLLWGKFGGTVKMENEWRAPDGVQQAMEEFIKKMQVDDMIAGVKSAFRKFPPSQQSTPELRDKRLRYFCGFCLNKIEGNPPWKKRYRGGYR